jgi:hypothetical protein
MRGLTHRYCTLATLLFCVSVAAAHTPASAVDSYPQRPIRLIVPFATGGGAVDAVQTGTVHDRPDLLYGMDEITELMGYSKIADLEAQFLPDDQLERKYGSEKPDYLVRDRKY